MSYNRYLLLFRHEDGRVHASNQWMVKHEYWTLCEDFNVLDGDIDGHRYALTDNLMRNTTGWVEIGIFDQETQEWIEQKRIKPTT